MSSSSQLVVVEAFSQPWEAHLACSALHAAGFAAHIADDHIVAADWLMSNAVGGVKVLVSADDIDAARDVLRAEAAVSHDEDDATPGANPLDDVDVCPHCGSEALSTTKSGVRLSALTWLLLGIPIVPVRRRTHCDACGQHVI